MVFQENQYNLQVVVKILRRTYSIINIEKYKYINNNSKYILVITIFSNINILFILIDKIK